MGRLACNAVQFLVLMFSGALLFMGGMAALDVPTGVGLWRTAAGLVLIGCGWGLCSYAYRTGGGNA